MTYARWPGSVEAVLMQAIHILSPAEILHATGVKENTIRKASNPETPGGLQFEHAAGLEAALQDKGHPGMFLEAFRHAVANARRTNRKPAVECIHRTLRQVAAEIGDVNRATDEALNDGVIDRHERAAIAREIQEAIDLLTNFRDALSGELHVIQEDTA